MSREGLNELANEIPLSRFKFKNALILNGLGLFLDEELCAWFCGRISLITA